MEATLTLPIAQCKRSLARIWFAGAGFIVFIVLLQSLLGRYGEATTRAWGWLLPTVLPTLSLIIGQLVFDAVQGSPADKPMDRFLYRLTWALSGFYLLAVLLVLLLTPFYEANSEAGPIELMNQSSVFLGPLQGLVTAAMGAFFVKAAKEGGAAEGAGESGGEKKKDTGT